MILRIKLLLGVARHSMTILKSLQSITWKLQIDYELFACVNNIVWKNLFHKHFLCI